MYTSINRNGKTHWIVLPWTTDRPGADVCLHNTQHSQKTHIYASGRVEPANPARERPKTYALGHAARVGFIKFNLLNPPVCLN